MLAMAPTWIFRVLCVPAQHGLVRVAGTIPVPLTSNRMGFMHRQPKDPVFGLVCLVTGFSKN